MLQIRQCESRHTYHMIQIVKGKELGKEVVRPKKLHKIVWDLAPNSSLYVFRCYSSPQTGLRYYQRLWVSSMVVLRRLNNN